MIWEVGDEKMRKRMEYRKFIEKLKEMVQKELGEIQEVYFTIIEKIMAIWKKGLHFMKKELTLSLVSI